MPEEKDAPDLLDLKFLPAWVKETPNENAYANYAGDEGRAIEAREGRGPARHGADRRGAALDRLGVGTGTPVPRARTPSRNAAAARS